MARAALAFWALVAGHEANAAPVRQTVGMHDGGLKLKRVLRRGWGCAVALALAGFTACTSAAPLADLPVRPGINVIVVSFDALRADTLGTYGYARDTSPRIDAFAQGALVFENAYAVTAVTPTSFAAFFTGRHPSSVFRNWRLHTRETLAARFAGAGYATAGFMRNGNLSAARGFGRGFQKYGVYKKDSDRQVMARARKWISARGGEPFLLWMHLLDPHGPWDFKVSAQHLYDASTAAKPRRAGAKVMVIKDAAELTHAKMLYDGEVFANDGRFGLFVEWLRQNGLLERSIVVFTSDHGEEFMQHGMLLHAQLNEEVVRIPMILHHPDLNTGRRIEAVVSQLDLFPTLAALAGVSVGPQVIGRDLRTARGDLDPLSATFFGNVRYQQASIRSGNWKLIQECGGMVRRAKFPVQQLYDLGADPGETNNLIKARRDVALTLGRALWPALGLESCADLVIDVGNEPDLEFEGLDEETLEQLESLGYIDG